ncbi:MAG: hypothetical protein FWD46_01110 [Cystobacterineae bacterium]|nr:hypothetical protein [Cystobacterineae bacterium]
MANDFKEDISAAVRHSLSRGITVSEAQIKKEMKHFDEKDFCKKYTKNSERAYIKAKDHKNKSHEFWIHQYLMRNLDAFTEEYYFQISHMLAHLKDHQRYLVITFKNGELWGHPRAADTSGGFIASIGPLKKIIEVALTIAIPELGSFASKLTALAAGLGDAFDKLSMMGWEDVRDKIQIEILRQMVHRYLNMKKP